MNVEIWSDVVCPWCYLGKRRFEAALARFARRDAVAVTWRGFELDPHAARRFPVPTPDELAHKLRATPAQVAATTKRLTALAAEEGLDYHLDRVQPGNTFDAHRLIHLAAEHGLQDAVKERLLRAYVTDGLPIGDADTLVEIVSGAGLDADEARAVLAGDAYAAAVRADERRGAVFGIRGVPFVVVDGRYGVSGAQPAEVFLETLRHAWAEAHPLAVASGAGVDACDGASCAV